MPGGAFAIIPIVGVTLAAALVGVAAESVLIPNLLPGSSSVSSGEADGAKDKIKNKADESKIGGKSKAAGGNDDAVKSLKKSEYVTLDGITVSLMDERRTRVRLASIVVLPSDLKIDREALIAELQSDISAHLRTLSVHDIETGIAISYLRDDLDVIVQMRAQSPKARLMIAGIIIE